MAFIADLHMHSKYSRACSRNLDLPTRWVWGQLKGVDLISIADFTHPRWFHEIQDQLEESAPGIYSLKNELTEKVIDSVPSPCIKPVRFILSTEVSLIYKKNGKCRKVHHIILAPNLDIASKINIALDARGNINSDGRPILGLDSKDLLQLLLEISPDIELIPAHIWTPHFSVFGSQSGFDTLEECFEELTPYIHALETGLSSDPQMNWRLSALDRFALVSNSDAHSPQKMGREATIFDTEMTYPAILSVLRNDHAKIAGTLEFFPEEGKYHADGLRSEKLCLNPEETKSYNFVSPQSGKKITVGVLHRVNDLSDRKIGFKPSSACPYWSIIPLPEIIAEIKQTSPASKKVLEHYFHLLSCLGSEFSILKDIPINDINKTDADVGEAITRMRKGQVILQPGYDGEYGKVRLFSERELQVNQMSLF